MRTRYWVGLLLAWAITGQAQVPYAFNYQGILRGGAGEMLPAGSKNVEFRLYKTATGGSAVWGRGYAVLLDTNGLFNLTLSDGSGSPVSDPSASGALLPKVVAANATLFMGLTVSGAAEIAPRQQLLSVPFAMMAGDVRSSSGNFNVNGQLVVTNGVTVTGVIQASSDLIAGANIRDKNGPLMPVGSVITFAGTATPPGWLLCDGSEVARTGVYADLFTAIGTTYGAGNGSSTFKLPDLRGRTAIGAGTGPGLTNRVLGVSVGEEKHVLSIPELPSHNHGITVKGSTEGFAAVEKNNGYWKNTSSSTTDSAGSGTAHENMQPSLVLKYIIKY